MQNSNLALINCFLGNNCLNLKYVKIKQYKLSVCVREREKEKLQVHRNADEKKKINSKKQLFA
jgi:hypothetical protein